MAKVVFSGQINKTYRLISAIFAFGAVLLLKGKKKMPLKKHVKRYNKLAKRSYNVLDSISNKITAQNERNGALDYEKCLKIYKRTVSEEES